MGPITLGFGKKCYNVTTPGDNLQISTKRVFIQAQVTAWGIFPWSDWSTINTHCRPVFMSMKLVLSRGSLRRFIHFYLRKKLGTRILWKELGLLLFKYCLKNGSNFPMNMSVKHVRWSNQIEKIGSAYIYIHIYHIYHITLVVPSRQCLFTYWLIVTFDELRLPRSMSEHTLLRLCAFRYLDLTIVAILKTQRRANRGWVWRWQFCRRKYGTETSLVKLTYPMFKQKHWRHRKHQTRWLKKCETAINRP